MFVVAVPAAGVADECRWWEIGCKPAEKLGESAEKVGKNVETASENVYSAVNFWAQLIQWYHAGTPEQKEKARQIIQGVFGLSAPPTGEFAWEVELRVRGVDTSKTPLRVMILTDYDEPTVKELAMQIYQGQRVELNPQTIIGNKPPSPKDPASYLKSLEAIQSDIAKVAQPAFLPEGMSNFGCRKQYTGPSDQAAQRNANLAFTKCVANASAAQMAKAIMTLADDRVDLRADQLTAAAPWLGQPYITIIVPDSDLAAQPDLELELTIHAKGKADNVLPTFANNPREVPRVRLVQSPAYKSPDPTHGGVYRAFTLRLHEIPVSVAFAK